MINIQIQEKRERFGKAKKKVSLEEWSSREGSSSCRNANPYQYVLENLQKIHSWDFAT
jgi:hypothetical protein